MRPAKSARGFTLIEVVVAALLIGMVAAPLMAAFANAFKFAKLADGNGAGYLINDKIQQLVEFSRADLWGDPPHINAINTGPMSAGTYTEDIVVDGTTYTRSYTVSSPNFEVQSRPLKGPRLVTMEVSWPTDPS
jgi:prepilin-type N-terminal cleavage/methylation domain-containing protein